MERAPTNKSLSQEEINALASIGKIAQNWWAVTYDKNTTPFAFFNSEEYATTYRDQFCKTAVIEPWPMIVKDMSKPKPDWKKIGKEALDATNKKK